MPQLQTSGSQPVPAEEEPLAAQAEEDREEPLAAQAEEDREEPLAAQAEEDREEPLAAQAEEDREEPLAAQAEEEEETTVAARSDDTTARGFRPGRVGTAFERDVRVAHGSGQALPDDARASMERSFGADFRDVRIHTGNEADRLNRDIGARAFTSGRDVFFRDGQFDTASRAGRHLLAHELTHVVQQTGAGSQERVAHRSDAAHVQRALGWIGERLHRWVKDIPGYGLFTVLLGRDPILNEPVPRTAVTFLRALFQLVPGGDALFKRLEESGTIDRAFAWLSAEVDKLGFTATYVKGLLDRAWGQVGLDLWNLSEKIDAVKAIFAPPVRRLIGFVRAIANKVLELAFEGLLRLVGAPVERVMKLFRRGSAVINRIVADPMAFVYNLARAVKQGIDNFVAKIRTYLIRGLITWLTGAISKAGLQLPEHWDARGIFSLVLQILGLTYDNIRTKLVERLGERTVARIESAFTFVRDLISRGPIVLWERVQDMLTNLKDTLIGGIRNWVITNVIRQGVIWLLSFLNPAGALLKIIRTLYDIVMFFVNNWNRIVTFAESVFNSIAEIAYGRLGPAATAIENALARSVPILIGFIANLLGLGGISEAITRVMVRIRAPVNRALDRVIGWIVERGRALLARGRAAVQGGAQAVRNLLFPEHRFADDGGEQHRLWIDTASGRFEPMVASSQAKQIGQLLNEAAGVRGVDRRRFANAQRLHTQLRSEVVKQKKADQAQVRRLESRLAKALAPLLVGGAAREGDAAKKRLILMEGLVAPYRSLPATGNLMDRDHQPQKALLHRIVTWADTRFNPFKYANGRYVNSIAARIARSGELSFWVCLFMGKPRHAVQPSTSRSGKGAAKASGVESLITEVQVTTNDERRNKRQEVGALLISFMDQVTRETRAVYDLDANYPDIASFTRPGSERTDLIAQVRRQGRAGAGRINSAAKADIRTLTS